MSHFVTGHISGSQSNFRLLLIDDWVQNLVQQGEFPIEIETKISKLITYNLAKYFQNIKKLSYM